VETFTVPRTGARPLMFIGERIFSVSTKGEKGPALKRWHELELYRTEGGKIAVRVSYRSEWKEAQSDLVEICSTPDEAEVFLQKIDPAKHVTGIPQGEQFRRKREWIETDLRSRWTDAVSQACAALGPVVI
jgi:hypothetical protein